MAQTSVSEDKVGRVRAFNRFYTRVIGVLGEGLAGTPFSLTEARVLYELAQRDETERATLRAALGLDAGYLSRILARLEEDALIKRQRSDSDARRQVVRLTAKGRREFRKLDDRSTAEIEGLLSGLTSDEQRRLVGAMQAIRDVLERRREPEPFVLRAPEPGDFGWVVNRHGAIYADEYGWDETFEALVARIVADFVERGDARRERAWIAEVDGSPVGCVFCVKKDETVAQLRLLLVDPSARGMGIGARLVEECLRFARRAGYKRMVLWTNDVLEDARRIYERSGFALVAEGAHHSFGHDLVEQTWSRPL